MRALLAALLLTGLALAGCAESDPHSHESYLCSDGVTTIPAEDIEAAAGHDNTTFDPETLCPQVTPPTPPTRPGGGGNELPTLVLTVVNDTGQPTLTTFIGGNLTFSAEASTDADGTVDAVAAVVTDANGTRVITLRRDGQDTPVTLKFPRPGPVDITLSGIDDRGGISTLQTNVYVNEAVTKGHGFTVVAPAAAFTQPACDGAVPAPAGSLVNTYYTYKADLPVSGNQTAGFITATVASGAALITICGPDGAALSPIGGGSVTTNEDANLNQTATATDPFYVWIISAGTPTGATNDVQVAIEVHYEPRAAAAA